MDVNKPAQAEQPHSESSGYLATTIDIFASPAAAFARIERRPTILFPLLLVVLPMLLVTAWYMQIVDEAWMLDDMIGRFGDMPPEQAEAIRNAASQSSMSLWSTLLGSAVSVTFLYGLHAGYLTLASLMSGDRFRFRHWFSLLCWTNLPMLLVTLVMAVNILLNTNGQLSLYDANSLSLASLGLSSESVGIRTLLDAFSLPLIWALALLVAAYHQWLHCGWLRATLVVLAPYLLIIAVVFFFAFR
ncbi:MAG: YIP1 family protein [Pseudohongiella sp.]|nr:YIP1 family protein [Pseudohongiella sp.]MDO9519968.1 YIP1 family protein [Pseudohongiella sp.]MDP2127131.1 YIP1 family protein [Pseudohongiella sp.]